VKIFLFQFQKSPGRGTHSLAMAIHLVPMARERTWEKKRLKDVKVIGMEDKRQVTVCVSSTADGYLLPFLIIYTGKTN
jgi:hypothetical protein